MIKRAAPEKVTQLDGRVFYAKYERVKRANLPPNRGKEGCKRRQRRKGFKSSIKKAAKNI